MTEPIRILRIIARLNVGGPAIHVALLTQKLGAPTYESTLVCGNIDADEGDSGRRCKRGHERTSDNVRSYS